MNRGIVAIVLAIFANIVFATALIRNSWSPIVILTLVLTALAIIAVCFYHHQTVINAAGNLWTRINANWGRIAKTALVVVFFASLLFVLWLLALKALTAAPTFTVPVPAAMVAPTTSASATPVAAPASKPVEHTITVRSDRPYRLEVPSGYRWDLVGKIPTMGWTTDQGSRDERGNRIQIFETVAPVREIQLVVAVKPCATPQECTW